MIEIEPMPAGGGTVRPAAHTRLTERHVLALGLAVSGMLVLGAALVAVVTAVRGGSPWAAIHLALAGAATVAIGTFMPHFAVTLAGTRARSSVERAATVLLLGTGAISVVLGLTAIGAWLAGIGAIAMLIGLVLVGIQTLSPLREPLARRHPIVTLTYGAALIQLAGGIAIGGLAAIGAPGVVSAWSGLRAAHAWLGLFGAISLTIFATLVYLAPTVLGARVRPSRSLLVGVSGMLIGPVVAAAGFALGDRSVVIGGMALTLLGALGQGGYLVDVARRRGPYTSEHDWRRVVVGHLLAGPAWFALAVGAALTAVVIGAPVRGWSIGVLAIPLVAGWLLQELIGSWTHLVPSVTPGGPSDHARQRRLLAIGSRTRLVATNLGVGTAWIGGATGLAPLAIAGALLLAAAVLVSLIALGRALSVGRY